jgi:hypothetical protein
MKSLARVLCITLLILIPISILAGEIKDVKVSPASFNPSIGQKIKISLNLPCKGLLKLEILDRDTYLVRTLLQNEIREGKQEFSWDGKSENGEIVPDEAYSLRAIQRCGSTESLYFPASNTSKEVKVAVANYDPLNALLRYTLSAASRVHIQAGLATLDPKTKEPQGPVMKVPVNREPRLGGQIAEQWNGMAESESSIYIPDLPNFAYSIFATELPENSFITVGNRTTSFTNYATKRTGQPLMRMKSNNHDHQGLDSLNDTAPQMKAAVSNGQWNSTDHVWEMENSKQIILTGRLDGVTASHFVKQPGLLEVFIDQKSSLKIQSPTSPFNLKLPLNESSDSSHIITLNWSSKLGPVAVNSMQIRINDSIARTAKKNR